MSDDIKLLKVVEAAPLLRVSARSVLRMIHSGDIRGIRMGRIWLIPSSEIDRLMVEGTGGGGSGAASAPAPAPASRSGGKSAGGGGSGAASFSPPALAPRIIG